MFQKLDGLLGAAVVVDAATRGILVTTERDLHVQRFTLAHELGHLLLEHETSLDETVGFAGRHGAASRPAEELAADTFASELLAPMRLMAAAARRHSWTGRFGDPNVVYQLSLRLGLSFSATSWALVTHKVLTRAQAEAMQARPVKELKRALAPAEIISDSWANVWQLTPTDTESQLEAGPEDLFAVHVRDDAGAGYLWELVDADETVEVVDEIQADPGSLDVGAPAPRVVYLRLKTPGAHRLVFRHTRPWSGSTIGHIDIRVENHGKETRGWPRRLREASLAGAA